MYLSTQLAEKIIDNCNLDDWGTHEVKGWNKYFDSWRLDYIKITVNQKTKNPRTSTRRNLLIKELQKRALLIRCELSISWSGHVSKEPVIMDPYGVLPLIKKYCCGQYEDLPYREKAV